MAIAIRQLHPLFAGEVSGIDIRQPLDTAQVAELDAAMDRYAVLVFRGQPLDQDQQIAFARSFGSLDSGLTKITRAKSRFKYGELLDISNVTETGEIAPPGHRRLASALANQLWHSDSSFQAVPGKYSMLSAVILPREGGETEFSDMRAAYDALPAAMKRKIADLVAEHFALHSRMWLGDTQWTEEQKRGIPPVRWPLVRRHPGSGRTSLFIGAHCTQIIGWPVPEGRMLLLDLLEHATQRPFVYRHTWQVGDLVVWDNRCTLHRGRPYDFSERRELRRTTTEDLVSKPVLSPTEGRESAA
jgi:alpha-ketoglutarate-dependent 2,4-dichlorophenoxyacetate dioxygenase